MLGINKDMSNALNDFFKSTKTTIRLAKKLGSKDIDIINRISDNVIEKNYVVHINIDKDKYKIDMPVARVLCSIFDIYNIKIEFPPQDNTLNQMQKQILSETRDISDEGSHNKNRASVHTISTDYKYYENEENTEYLTEEFNNILKKYLKDNNIVPSFGDFIVDEVEYGYRNNGVYMWDGNDIVFLSWDPDDYGCLPEPFSVWVPHPEKGFIIPPRYWEFIDHNTMTRFNNHKQHNENMVMKYDDILLGGLYALYVTWDNVHFIVFDVSESDNIRSFDYEDVEEPFDNDVLELLKDEFGKLLEQDNIMFAYTPYSGLYNNIDNDNILFLTPGRWYSYSR